MWIKLKFSFFQDETISLRGFESSCNTSKAITMTSKDSEKSNKNKVSDLGFRKLLHNDFDQELCLISSPCKCGTGLPHGRQHRMQPLDYGFIQAFSISLLIIQIQAVFPTCKFFTTTFTFSRECGVTSIRGSTTAICNPARGNCLLRGTACRAIHSTQQKEPGTLTLSAH